MGKQKRGMDITLELIGTATVAEAIRHFRGIPWFGVPTGPGGGDTAVMAVAQVAGKANQPPRAPRPNERRPGRKKNAKREGRRKR